jgi:hypothetical protein
LNIGKVRHIAVATCCLKFGERELQKCTFNRKEALFTPSDSARSERSRGAVRVDLSRIASRAFGYQGMRRFGLYAALALCVCGLPATAAAERFGQWLLDQPRDFIFALSSKRTISFDDRTSTSELAFVCHQENKYVAVLLIPLDGTFNSRHETIPVAI